MKPESLNSLLSPSSPPSPHRGRMRSARKEKTKLPDKRGYYGPFGGRFVPETLVKPLEELEESFRSALATPSFAKNLRSLLRSYAGRPTPLFFAERLTRHLGGARIYLKREDLCHTGSHKINNVLGQALLTQKLGKKRVICETGAGQHGVAAASAAALLGLECDVYMGEEDMRRQELNVFRIRLLGAKVIPVASGTKTLKDAINEALRDWVTNVRSTHYLLGSAVGPHPFPWIVREFQSVIGREAKVQIKTLEGHLPDALLACVGGGSNSIGLFAPFYEDRNVHFIGVEAGGHGLKSQKHAATLVAGQDGILHGARTLVLQDKNGQILSTHSISAGLDYPGVGPEHSFYKWSGRAEYRAATDDQALEGFQLLSKIEGIIPSLEPAHAIGLLPSIAKEMGKKACLILCLSGRGDKDAAEVKRFLENK